MRRTRNKLQVVPAPPGKNFKSIFRRNTMKSAQFLVAALALTAATGAFASYDDGASDSAFLKQAAATATTQAPAPAPAAAPVQRPAALDASQFAQP
jgi:hypothetical protein